MFKFKVIVPKELKLNIESRLADRLRQYVPHIIDDLNKSTEGWDHKVVFRYSVRQYKSKNVTMRVWTDDEIWNWVNFGTKGPYPIWAGFYTGKSDKKALTIFDQKPATMPAVLASAPSKRGPLVALRTHIEHPGIKPRRFDLIVQLRHSRPLVEIIKDELNKCVADSGYMMRRK